MAAHWIRNVGDAKSLKYCDGSWVRNPVGVGGMGGQFCSLSKICYDISYPINSPSWYMNHVFLALGQFYDFVRGSHPVNLWTTLCSTLFPDSAPVSSRRRRSSVSFITTVPSGSKNLFESCQCKCVCYFAF